MIRFQHHDVIALIINQGVKRKTEQDSTYIKIQFKVSEIVNKGMNFMLLTRLSRQR